MEDGNEFSQNPQGIERREITTTTTTTTTMAPTLRQRRHFESPTAEVTQEKTPTKKQPNEIIQFDSADSVFSESSELSPKKSKQPIRDESKLRKILTRIFSGLVLISVFNLCVYCGHLYVCLLVLFCEVVMFRELVKVRYHANFSTIRDTIPLFRTTQWLWFVVAIFYTYGDFISEIIKNNPQMHRFWPFANYFGTLAFFLYSSTFVLTISTMQVGHIKFQLNQLCWTLMVICITVGQMKYIMHNIFNGLFWFVFPILAVVVNDIMAYVCGMTCGRKFIHRSFIPFSPNKTWEGFIGGGICTIIVSWHLAKFLAQYKWMVCPTNEFRFVPGTLECQPHHIFQEAQSVFPPQIFELFPSHLVKMIPGIVEYCSVEGTEEVTRCISGEITHTFHHFELILRNVYPIQIHALWLGSFASLVAPFGGFLASAIKRAYKIKDFDTFIPGHGGLTDRFDCQFLMMLYTWVHYNTFVRMATVSATKLLYFYNMLNEDEKRAFVEAIAKSSKRQIRKRLEGVDY